MLETTVTANATASEPPVIHFVEERLTFVCIHSTSILSARAEDLVNYSRSDLLGMSKIQYISTLGKLQQTRIQTKLHIKEDKKKKILQTTSQLTLPTTSLNI